jgi:hypothetical protein
MALRVSDLHEDAVSIVRVGWAARRLISGPGPVQALSDFLGRHDTQNRDVEEDLLSDRAENWLELMGQGGASQSKRG